jgi:hypothetical protein
MKKIPVSEYWKGHVLAQGSSGLTQPAYCKQEQLNLNSFVYQRSRLIKDDKPIPKMPFIKAIPSIQKMDCPSPALQIILVNGTRILLDDAVNSNLLDKVLRMVGGG